MSQTIPSLTVRRSTADDMIAVDMLLSRSYPALLKADYPASVLVTALPIISRAQPDLLRSGTYFVVEKDGNICGAGGWTRAAPQRGEDAAQTGHIRHVVTDHRQTRQGIGRALMTTVLADAKEHGMLNLHCQATLTAVPFYTALGFLPQHRIDVPLRPGITFPAMFMLRAL
ncbi:GNAT family N-acetyltransferase [Thalassovita sp.]|uniref:GNAT family N-acetyltransferase n=1 Tax=Thalassovita sp. TaxID=1979401 RepID=UPI002B2669D1|nr:GNAT family N-acetyltransferase [Thalassovita sp.]